MFVSHSQKSYADIMNLNMISFAVSLVERVILLNEVIWAEFYYKRASLTWRRKDTIIANLCLVGLYQPALA